MRLILASSSPRRRALLLEAGYTLEIVPPEVPEAPAPGESPASYVVRNARAKAEWVARRRPAETGLILGADTVVVQDGMILEKPSGPEEARAMLRRLAGRGHDVWTGVCLIGRRTTAFAERTAVFFRPLGDDQIDAYIATGEPLDKAGAYAIQGLAGAWIDRIEGSYTNVVGLPLERLRTELQPA